MTRVQQRVQTVQFEQEPGARRELQRLILKLAPDKGIEHAERLVHQEDVGVGGYASTIGGVADHGEGADRRVLHLQPRRGWAGGVGCIGALGYNSLSAKLTHLAEERVPIARPMIAIENALRCARQQRGEF